MRLLGRTGMNTCCNIEREGYGKVSSILFYKKSIRLFRVATRHFYKVEQNLVFSWGNAQNKLFETCKGFGQLHKDCLALTLLSTLLKRL